MTAEAEVRGEFPAIKPGFSVESPQDGDYNCIAWAAGRSDEWWWPSYPDVWPIPYSLPTLDAFQQAFWTLGYGPADNENFEPGVEKVAIYVRSDGMVTHMARQLEDGTWASKLGPKWDIYHVSVECLNGQTYGRFHSCLSRRRPANP